MRKLLFIVAAFLVATCATAPASSRDFQVVNGAFEDGLKGWKSTGDVHVETHGPLEGKASVIIGPGPGSVSQRIDTGSGNDFTVSAMIQSQLTNGWVFAIRCLDKHGHEVMRVDSMSDLQRDKKDPRKFDHFMKAHPLTRWIEIVISKDATAGTVLIDQVGLDMKDENAADLKSTCDLDQAMQPFWLGKRVENEAVLMLSESGKPATGRLMYQPSRIILVQDYGLATNYVAGTDYTVDGRTLVCAASSHMTQVRAEDLSEKEYAWNVVGGKQTMVTYEHNDTWNHPLPQFVGDNLPHTIEKLKEHAPLTVVAYGDSITHGVGASRLAHIPPYLPPWPELLVYRLKEISHDKHIQLYNSAQSGATSTWAKDYARRMVNSLNPDLVIIAFGQNDFWSLSAETFSNNIAETMKIVREQNPAVEFVLVSPLRFDPVYTSNAQYWNVVGKYAAKLKSMTGPGVQFVDMTAVSEWVYAAKNPRDCVNDPLHPNDYFARWYAQCLVATLNPRQ
jgi:lysophospholipase L1-like esterase